MAIRGNRGLFFIGLMGCLAWGGCVSAPKTESRESAVSPAAPESSASGPAAESVPSTDSAASPATENAPPAEGQAPAAAGGSDAETLELAKRTQNPVSDLISVPIELDMNFNAGPLSDQQQNVTLIKPVWPIGITENWNLIARAIVPFIDPADLGPVEPYVDNGSGIGDIVAQFFLSPAKPGKLIWGIGPQFTFPTASHDLSGSGKYSAGPAAVALAMSGPWVYGALATQQWDIAGEDYINLKKKAPIGFKDGEVVTIDRLARPDVNLTTLQPFITYNLKHGWALSTSPIMTANWEAASGDVYTVPVGLAVSKIVRVGKLPVQLKLGSYYNVVRPENSSNWQAQFSVGFLFPKGKRDAGEKKVTSVLASPPNPGN